MNRKIEYKIDGPQCLTKCSYLEDPRPQVGSVYCQDRCKYHVNMNKDTQVITCRNDNPELLEGE